MPPIPSYKQPLPQCKGSKLHPFQNFQQGKADTKFKRLLKVDQGTPDCAEEGGHAYVFEVSINSKTYALKIFKFCEDDFDQMIEDEGVRTWVRALPNDDFLDKLRPRVGKERCYKQTRRYRRKRVHHKL